MPDPLCYSFHAVARCLERGITERKVVETVRSGVCISDSDDRAVYARGRMRVVVSGGVLVVTAFRLRRKSPKRIMRERRKRERLEIQSPCANRGSRENNYSYKRRCQYERIG